MSDKLEFSEEGFQQLKRKNRLQLIGVSAIILVTGLFLGKSWLAEEQSQSATADNVDMYTASGVLGSNGITEEQADKLDVGQAVILEPLPGEEENVQQVELNNPLVVAEEAASTPTEASRLPNAAMTTAAVAATAATTTAALTPKKDTAVYELKEGQETVTAADPDGGLRTVVKKAEPNAHYDGAPLPVVTISSAKVDNKEQVLTLQEKATTPTEVKKVETPVETTKVVETKTAVEKKQQTEVAAKQQAEAKRAERAEEAKRVAEQKRQAELKAKQQAEAKKAEEAKRVAEQKKQAELKAKQQAEAKRKAAADKAQAALNNQSGKQSANPKAILNGEQSGKAIVQAGAYTSESQAKQIQQRLAQAGIKTHINEFNTAKGTTLYRVRTGSYPNRAAANQALGRIRMQGVEGKIIGQP